MTAGTDLLRRCKEKVFRAVLTGAMQITRPSARAEPGQHRRIRLLAAFMLIMSVTSLIGSLSMKGIDGNTFKVMLATAIAFILGYFISRTRYHQIALGLAITLPAVPSLAIPILRLPEISSTTEIMWLALPLIVASLMLTVKQTICVAFIYLLIIGACGVFGLIEIETMAPIMSFISIIAFFVIAITYIRRKDQTELADEATRRRILVDQSRDGIVILDQDGRVYEANRRFAEMIGYSQEEVMKLSVWDWEYLYPPDQVREMIRTVTEEGDHFETRHQRKDGTTYDVEISTNGATFAGQKLIFCVCRDITERKQMEKALRESEEKFSKAFHVSPNAIAITTLKRGKYIDVNDSFTRYTGYTSKELIGRSSNDINIWAKTKDRSRLFKILKEQGRVHDEEFEFRMKSGEIRTWLFSAEHINIASEPCLIGVSTDITERKKIEEALKESEEKFSAAFRSSPNTMAITRVRDGKFINVNDSHVRVTGFSREETIGHTSIELGLWRHEEDRVRMLEILKKNGSVNSEEFEFRMKSGEIRTWLFSAEKLSISGEPYIISITVDITERKRTEKLQQDENYVLTLLAEGAELDEMLDAVVRLGESYNPGIKGSVMLYDTQKQLLFPAATPSLPPSYSNLMENGVAIGPNSGACGTAAYRKERVIIPDLGKSSLFPKEVVEQATNAGLLACQSQPVIGSRGELLGTIANYSSKTGKPSESDIRVLEWSARVAAIAIERKQAEEALRESDAAFKSIHESVITTNLDNEITHWNDISEQLFGMKASEVMGKKFTEVIEVVETYPGEARDRVATIRNQGHWEDERLYRTKKGEIWVDVHLQDIVSNGKHYGRVMLASDITKRKQAETELKQALAELEQSSAQLAATNKELETFSYSVSHDLRSPLRSIDGFSQALLEDYEDKLDGTAKDYLQRLRMASQKMGELIDGLLKLSRLTRGEMNPETVDLSALAEEIAARLRETQPERKVKFVIDQGITANGDPQLLRALLENLLGNAWKFTSKKAHARIEFGLDHNGDKKAYFIRDNGAGFDMTYANKLFGAFQRLHDASEFPGAGIGLATVQRIINRHGGTIRAEGAVDKGATFYFTLN